MASKNSTEVAEVKSSALAVPSFLQERAVEAAGLGNSTRAEDNSLPFLAVIQKGSPQVNENKPEFIEGARAGSLLNTATSRIWSGKEGLVVIPFFYQKKYVEWVPRDNGGGYVATHEFDREVFRRLGAISQKKGPPVLPNGNQLVETAYTFVLLEDSPMPLVIGASSTALGPMRDWMSMRNEFLIGDSPAPAFARSYLMQTAYKENDQGDWYIPKISDRGWLESEVLFNRALEFARVAAEGGMTVGRPDEMDGSGGQGAPGTEDDGIPV